MKPLALLIVLAVSTLVANAQSLNIYHNIVKKVVRKNFKLIEEHRPEEMMSGLSDKNLEHTFAGDNSLSCLLYTSPSPRDRQKSRMPSSA